VYVADAGVRQQRPARLLRFSAAGTAEAAAPVDARIGGLAVDRAGTVYLADAATGRVLRGTFAPGGEAFVPAGSPWPVPSANVLGGVAVDARGRVYVTSANGAQVHALTTDGEVRTVLGLRQRLFAHEGGFKDVAAGPDGALYVAAGDGRCVYRFAPDGRLVARWDLPSDGRGQPARGASVAVGPGGTVYAAPEAGAVVWRPVGRA
jgi:sugar lactone lactonase YvrE